jgi:hypothetical protein
MFCLIYYCYCIRWANNIDVIIILCKHILTISSKVSVRDADKYSINEHSFDFLLFKLMFYYSNVHFCQLAFIV